MLKDEAFSTPSCDIDEFLKKIVKEFNALREQSISFNRSARYARRRSRRLIMFLIIRHVNK